QVGKLNQAISWFGKAVSLSPLRMPKARLALSVALVESVVKNKRQGAKTRGSRLVHAVYSGVCGALTLPLDGQSFRLLQQAVLDDCLLMGVNWVASGYSWFGWHRAASGVLSWANAQYPAEAQLAHRLGDAYLNLGDGLEATMAYEQALALELEAMDRLW